MYYMDYECFPLLKKNTVLLTANRRLASGLHREYASYQQSLGNTVWVTPTILPLNTWFTQLWEAQALPQQLLSDFQERCLWKKISGQPWSSIALVQQAWKNLALWDIPLDALNNQHNDTTDAFYRWAREFQTLCKKRHWVTSAELPALLKTATHLPKQCFLLGFDDLPPAIEHFFDAIKNSCKVNHNHEEETTIHRITLANTETEIQTMASWAKQQYQNNPQQKIGCIVPNLSQMRAQVHRIFTETFSIETLLPGVQEKPSPFNISAGQALTEFPIIQSALQVLQLSQNNNRELPWENILQSPYLCATDTDIDIGALVDEKRRKTLDIDFPLSALLPIFTAFHNRFPESSWLHRWRHFLHAEKDIPEKQMPSEWCKTFTVLLKTLGWPGHRGLNSDEHQVFTRFTKSLEEFSQCDMMYSKIDRDTALAIFMYQLSTTLFQSQGSNTPIQILGFLEASGISFDTLWIMGLHNQSWPPPASPNPFIPHHLQIQHKMPHASAARELAFTEQAMKRLLTSAKEILLSAPSQENDKRLQPSRFIEKYPEITLPLPKDKSYAQTLFESSEIETLIDEMGPRVGATEATRGGSHILKLQAICPFRAFAAIRLNANSPEHARIGISARDKGKLLHRILENLWTALKDQNTLLNLSEDTVNQTIEKIVNQAIADIRSSSQSLAHQHFLSLERDQLIHIVKEWLTIEKERLPFSVLEHETERHIKVGSLSLNLRIDRIDKLEDGREIIIDYKTGLTNPAQWFTDRPPEPQLPLYCVYGNTDSSQYAGVAYAQVRPYKMTFKGISEEAYEEEPAPGIVSIERKKNCDEITNWEAMLKHWRKTLEQLSNDFSSGTAAVDPLESACTYCELQPLCRIQETT